MKIPEKGLSREEVFQKLEAYKGKDLEWKDGKAFGYIYDPGEEARQVCKDAFAFYLTENGLDPTNFPSLLKLETELVEMARNHLRGDENCAGHFTSGGTESILLANKGARDYGRDKKGITEPEMILPVTAHAAFHKGSHYLGVKKVVVDVDPITFKVKPEDMAAAVNDNTILLVASATQYAQGVVDPIPEIGEIAQKHDLLFHVDGCIGGFILPYFRRLGKEFPNFDFTVPGVTSISMDYHKYAYAPKGASIIIYRNKELRKYQYFTCASWSGYAMVNPAVQSSKSGGPLAGAWSALNFIGDDGYMEMAKGLLEATDKVVKAVGEIEDLKVLGSPDMNLVAVASDTVNIFHVIDEMNERGWYLQPQLKIGHTPENFHLAIHPANIPHMDGMLKDLAEVVDVVKAMPADGGMDQVEAMLGSMDLKAMGDDELMGLMAMAGIENMQLPKRMAMINGLLNTLPSEVNEKLLAAFLNELFTYRA